MASEQRQTTPRPSEAVVDLREAIRGAVATANAMRGRAITFPSEVVDRLIDEAVTDLLSGHGCGGEGPYINGEFVPCDCPYCTAVRRWTPGGDPEET